MRRIRECWREVRWPVLGALALAAILLGYLGFGRYDACHETAGPWSFWDKGYLAGQLFTMQGGNQPPPVPWTLEVARWLAPAVATIAGLRALLALFGDQWARFRVRWLRGHVIVCGLGYRGTLLARRFHQRGFTVVGLEKNPLSPSIAICRQLGMSVLVGDAVEGRFLERAGITRALYLIVASGDDNTSAEIAFMGCRLAGRRRPLTSLVYIDDFDLCRVLTEAALTTDLGTGSRLEFFNAYQTGPPALFGEYPPFDEKGRVGCRAPHILVAGLGHMGCQFVVQSALRWRLVKRDDAERLRVTLLDVDARRGVDDLLLRYPGLGTVCDLRVLSSPESVAGEGVTSVYVCLDDDATALSTAIVLHRRFGASTVVVRTTEKSGLANVVSRAAGLNSFDLLERICRPEILLNGTNEILARAIHEEYVRQKRRTASMGDPSMANWDDLPETLKESNRGQASHAATKLAAIGCGIEPWTAWDLPAVEFTAGEIERMAVLEHDRWCVERAQQGWTLGTERDPIRRTSPHLVPWKVLSEDVRELDRNAVRTLPGFLARVGFRVVRVDQPRPDASGPLTRPKAGSSRPAIT